MTKACPIAKFRKSVNMTPAEIRAWAQDPRSRLASFAATRRRLPHLAKLLEKRDSTWTKADCALARRVISFNARMAGVVRKHGCTTRAVVALRNWGRRVACPLPKGRP